MRLLPAVVLVVAVALVESARPAAAFRGVRLEVRTDGTVAVLLTVDGAGRFRFLLDTGSAGSTVSDDIARSLGAPTVAQVEVTTSSGAETAPVVRLDRVDLGPMSVEGLLASLVPAARLGDRSEAVDGVLGQDFLSRFNYTIDYERRRLECDAAGAEAMGIRLPLEEVEGRYLVALPQAGGSTLRVVPDSGSSGLVVFERSGAPALPLLLNGPAMRIDTLAGRRTARSGTLLELRIGSLTWRRRPVTVVARGDWRAAYGDGLLPLHLFGRVSFHAREGWMAVSGGRGPER
jgi:Aspartyl protease